MPVTQRRLIADADPRPFYDGVASEVHTPKYACGVGQG